MQIADLAVTHGFEPLVAADPAVLRALARARRGGARPHRPAVRLHGVHERPDGARVRLEDPLVGRWLEHARADARLGDSVLWHDSVDFTRDRGARVQAMLGIAGILRSGAPNPRFAYMPINPAIPGALEFAAALGAKHLEQLDLELGTSGSSAIESTMDRAA